MIKLCSKCKVEKDTSLFYKNSSHTDGYKSSCKECFNYYIKEHRSKPEAKNTIIKNKYNLTLTNYNEMVIAQNDKCYICNSHNNNKPLVIDHDHTNGKVRKLLCHNCNVALGFVRDNKDTLNKMISYLEQFEKV